MLRVKKKDTFLFGVRGLKQIWRSTFIKKQGNITKSDIESFAERTKHFLDRSGYLRWYNKLPQNE